MDWQNFIERHKKDYFIWVRENSPCFPGCCLFSSIILGSYLKSKGVDVLLRMGNMKGDESDARFHMWIEIHDYIIDFTYFQFKMGDFDYYDFPPEKLYNLCIEDSQQNRVIFTKTEYYREFAYVENAKLNYSFSKIAKSSNSFKKYLNILESMEIDYPMEKFCPNFYDICNTYGAISVA